MPWASPILSLPHFLIFIASLLFFASPIFFLPCLSLRPARLSLPPAFCTPLGAWPSKKNHAPLPLLRMIRPMMRTGWHLSRCALDRPFFQWEFIFVRHYVRTWFTAFAAAKNEKEKMGEGVGLCPPTLRPTSFLQPHFGRLLFLYVTSLPFPAFSSSWQQGAA